ncbi:MAG: hypothetical protein ACRCXM_06850 [Beijerinckiaceae bacterium]
MADPTHEDFVRALNLAVRPSAFRAPVLSYARSANRPLSEKAPVTRAQALAMTNILAIAWFALLAVMHVPTIEEREATALAMMDAAEPHAKRVAINSVPPHIVQQVIARMNNDTSDDALTTGSVPDIPHPRDTRGYAALDRALGPDSVLTIPDQRKLLNSIRQTERLAYETHIAAGLADMTATGSIPRGSDHERAQTIAQRLGQGNGPAGRSIDIDMDKPALRGSL